MDRIPRATVFKWMPYWRGLDQHGRSRTLNGDAMSRFSLRTLLGLAFLAALTMSVYLRFNSKPPFSGLSTDIGDGFSHVYYGEDSEGSLVGRMNIEITESITAIQPEWRPTSANPPVSARQALSIADNFRKTRFRDFDDVQWSLSSVALKPLDLKKNKWCWVINFELQPEPGLGGSGMWPEFPVYVMMDGSVIEPNDPNGYLQDKYFREQSDGPKSRFGR